MSDPAPLAAEPGAPRPPEDYLRLLSESEQLLDDVDQALVRIREGTYRTCEVCGGAMPEAWLSTQPAVRRCPDHTAS